jgi:signal transduction histidine kinase/DNA-binding response OmpR family regulator
MPDSVSRQTLFFSFHAKRLSIANCCTLWVICVLSSFSALAQIEIKLSIGDQAQGIAKTNQQYIFDNDTGVQGALCFFGFNREFELLQVEVKSATVLPYYHLFSPFREFILYPVPIRPAERLEVTVASTSVHTRINFVRNPELVTEKLPEIHHERMGHYLEIAFCGMMLIMAVYMVGKYLQVRTRDYLFYTLHLLITFLFFLAVLHESNLSQWYSNGAKGQALHHVLQTLSHVCYFQFIRYFIHTKHNQPRFDSALQVVTIISLTYVVLELLPVTILNNEAYPSSILWIVMRVMFLLFGLTCLFVWVTQSTHTLKKYLIVGTTAMLIGGMLGMLFYFYPGYIQSLGYPFNQQIIYFRMGILIEVLFFSLGLGYKQKLEEIILLRMEAKLQQEHSSLVNLMELDQFKSRFFADISHEFRTPLTLILGALQSIRSKTNGLLESEVHSIQKNSHTLLQLVNQLLDLSRLEAGKMEIKVGPVHLTNFLRALAQSFMSMAENKKIEFSIAVDEFPHPGYADPGVIEKIVNNLLSNAFRYNHEKGKVQFWVEFQWPWLVIHVRDTGPGIRPDHQDKIFERFFRIDQNGTQGTGLGLSLVKELVKLHKGEIKVNSVVNEGSIFTVKLPVAKEFYKPTERHETLYVFNGGNAVPHNGHEDKGHSLIAPIADDAPVILIVEDNEELRHFIKEGLQASYKIITAQNGEEGIKRAIQGVPDLIISDWMMPGATGIDLCNTLKKNDVTNHIPIILLTAKAEQDSRMEGLETGADDYLTKPFEMMELKVRLKNLIDQRSVLREKFSRQGILGYQSVRMHSVEDKFLKRLHETLEGSIGNTQFSIDDLAEAMGMSRIQLYRKCNALTQKSPKELLQHYRLDRAADLLRQRAGNVSEVAYQVGYENLSHFAKSFRKHFGRLPSEVVPKS